MGLNKETIMFKVKEHKGVIVQHPLPNTSAFYISTKSLEVSPLLNLVSDKKLTAS